MASIKEATANAISFARDTLGTERTKDIRLEEIESTTGDDGVAAWRITLSMIAPAPIEPGNALSEFGALFGKFRREYKVFTVLKQSGEVESMKMRELADA